MAIAKTFNRLMPTVEVPGYALNPGQEQRSGDRAVQKTVRSPSRHGENVTLKTVLLQTHLSHQVIKEDQRSSSSKQQ